MVGSAAAGRDRLLPGGKPCTPRAVGRQAPASERQSMSTSCGQGEGARATPSSGSRDHSLARNAAAIASEADRSKTRWQQETEPWSPPLSVKSKPWWCAWQRKTGIGLSNHRLGQELLKVISPLGVEASLKALGELSAGDAAQRAALSNILEELEYEAKKAFEQYDAVDARNRLVAGELERRWNEKLEEVETTKQRLSSLIEKRWSLSSDEEERIRLMGENFAESWHSDNCPPIPKKMIFRTTTEEIVVRSDADKKTLESSEFTGRAACTLNFRWSGRVPRLRRRHLWRPQKSFAGWQFVMVTTRLPPC